MKKPRPLQSESMRLNWADPEYRAANISSIEKINKDPAQIAARSQRLKQAWADGKYNRQTIIQNFKGKIFSASDSVPQPAPRKVETLKGRNTPFKGDLERLKAGMGRNP